METNYKEFDIEELNDLDIFEMDKDLEFEEKNVNFSHTEPRPSTTSICTIRP